MEEKLKYLERNLNYSIEYNPHKLLYENIEEYLINNYKDEDIIDKVKVIENDRLYEVIIYDVTAIGSYRYVGYDLVKILDKITSDFK